MHIVLATLEYPTEAYRAGGMGWAFFKIAQGLKARGHAVTVLVRSDREEKVIDAQGIEVRRYPVREFLPGRLRKALAWRFPLGASCYNEARSLYGALDAYAREATIDAVLAAAAPDSYFAAGARRWPYVCRISSYRLLIVISNLFPVGRGFLFEEWMKIAACRRAHGCFAPSHLLAGIFSSLGCGETRRVLTPLDSPAPPTPAADAPSHYLLFYGSLQGTKGAHLLADALPRVLDAFPEMHMVWIGRDLSAPDFGSMTEYVERRLAAYRDRVRVLGVLEQAEALQWLLGAEWVLFPSIMDNLPNALLEAMWLSRPVIVTRGSGVDELIEDGRNGLVVDRNSVDALVDGLCRGLELDERERTRLGNEARRTVAEQCKASRVAAEVESLLVRAAARHGKTRRAGPGTAVRLGWLMILWAFRVLRVLRTPVSAADRRRIEELGRRYLPGYPLRFAE